MKSNGDFSFLGSLWSTDCATPSVRPERLDESPITRLGLSLPVACGGEAGSSSFKSCPLSHSH